MSEYKYVLIVLLERLELNLLIFDFKQGTLQVLLTCHDEHDVI